MVHNCVSITILRYENRLTVIKTAYTCVNNYLVLTWTRMHILCHMIPCLGFSIRLKGMPSFFRRSSGFLDYPGNGFIRPTFDRKAIRFHENSKSCSVYGLATKLRNRWMAAHAHFRALQGDFQFN